jgi:nucleoside-diphosphate-sugar epimerase
LTGVPGWLTAALLDDLERAPLADLEEVAALIHRPADQLQARHKLLTRFIVCDLGAPGPLDGQLAGITTVLHSAAVIHVRRTSDWYRVNTEGTLRLAEASRRAGVRRFVYISSNAAGGCAQSATHLMTEDEPPRPLSHYGRSKLLAEEGLLKLHQQGKFEVVILRPSMFYGPPVPERHVNIYRRICSGVMPLIGSGDYARSITHIDNLVQACRLAFAAPQAAGRVYYIVDAQPYTTRQIYDEMARALGVPLKLVKLPASAAAMAYLADRGLAKLGLYIQPLHLVGEANWHVGISPERARRELGYRPHMELAGGMQQAVEWCRSNGLL